MRRSAQFIGLIILASAVACGVAIAAPAAGVKETVFGRMPDGQVVHLYTLTNRNAMQAEITNYGARIVSLIVPDRHGRMADVVLGFDHLKGYLGNDPYFGAIVGRFGNRIAKGEFKLDGVEYHLAINNGPNSLHGGINGFDKKVWTARAISQPHPEVALTYLSKNGEEGYPGDLHVKVVYTLENDNALRIDYTATTDKDTVLNLTNHSYFNLSGAGNGNILNEVLMINSSKFTPTDDTQIPTGEIRSVAGTPFDFRKPTAIGARIDENNQQLKFAHGYDDNWILDRKGPGLTLAARVTDPASGRVLEVYTTQPGLQFYTANYLDGAIRGKGGKIYGNHSAFTMETQHYPDAPNHPNFPTTELKPGQTYHETTIFKFSTEK
ncbi:MAG: galactose mutarotase [Acidobacteriota bacterium]|nr:galactose mutarotase [Acidobacteriota bacterium]